MQLVLTQRDNGINPKGEDHNHSTYISNLTVILILIQRNCLTIGSKEGEGAGDYKYTNIYRQKMVAKESGI